MHAVFPMLGALGMKHAHGRASIYSLMMTRAILSHVMVSLHRPSVRLMHWLVTAGSRYIRIYPIFQTSSGMTISELLISVTYSFQQSSTASSERKRDLH